MKHFLTILLAVIASVAATYLWAPTSPATTAEESAFERVTRTGVLRCGYGPWDGGINKNAEGQLVGAWVDIMNELARLSELKIEWVGEVGWGDVATALKTNKMDAMCAGMWQSGVKGKHMLFSTPLHYQTVEALIQANDTRFEGKPMSSMNNEMLRIAVVDNDNSYFIATGDFPKAERVSLGQMGTDSDLMLNVATGKADITFTLPGLYHVFQKTNPGKLKRAYPNQPLRVFGNTLAVNGTEHELKQLLDTAAYEALNSGSINKILTKWSADYPEMFMPAAKVYGEYHQ